MKKIATLFFVLAVTTSASIAVADTGELDPNGSAAPQGLIVRDDGQGHRTVFKADGAQAVKSDADAAAALAQFATPANKVVNVVAQSELDRVSSTGSCYYWYPYNSYYGYGYYSYGYNYYYQPCYNWYNSGYYYYYYYRY